MSCVTAGRCSHRPLRNSIVIQCVGADAYIGPVAPTFKSCVGVDDPVRPGPTLQKLYCRAAPMCAAAHRTPCKVSLRGRAAPVAIRSPCTAPAVMPPAAPFLSAAKEREERTPSKPMVLKSFSRLECRLCRFSFATRMKTSKFRSLLSQRLCV